MFVNHRLNKPGEIIPGVLILLAVRIKPGLIIILA
jgi:hypothetical protein